MFHVELDAGGAELSAAQRVDLDRFAALLTEVAVPRGFVGDRDAGLVRTRHVDDGLRALPHLRDVRTCTDLGSGAGLPGIPLAIALPEVRFRLVEAQERRVAFLELVVAELTLVNVEVVRGRAEGLVGTTQACTARALADLRRAWGLARPLLEPGGRLVYFAGATFEAPGRLAGAAGIRIDRPDELASGGPLVIITAE